MLGVPLQEVHRLATIYQLIEYATSVKPRALQVLLKDHDEAYYLDPDLYLTADISELSAELAASEGGLLVTPHFLTPPTPEAPLKEGHLLTVGIYNLGFCGVDRRAAEFLDWWCDRLRTQCLVEPLNGLFVDQKWVDIGADLFRGRALRHPGYNIGIGNLYERPLDREDGQLVVTTTGDPLRLFHFHAFDPDRPTELSTRFRWSTADVRQGNDTLDALCVEYADSLKAHARGLTIPDYPYNFDRKGKELSRQIRRAYRLDWEDHGRLPSPFLPDDEQEWASWRRSAWRRMGRSLVGDAAKSARLVLPEEAGRLMAKAPRLRARIRNDYVEDSGLWG